MKKLDTIRRLLEPGVIAILRADEPAGLVEATAALIAGGIGALEVTMTTPDALRILGEVRAKFGERIVMGVGSVLDAETARHALLAGAQFLVTPVVRPEVIQVCLRYGIPVASGATTPTEALTAHELGSDFIKIFPADNLGPTYMKAMLSPLPMLRIIPTGGVTPENVPDYFAAGCVAVGAGSTLLGRDILASATWDQLTARAEQFVAAAKKTARR